MKTPFVKIVVFVNEFSYPTSYWNSLISFIENDPQLKDNFRIHVFEYSENNDAAIETPLKFFREISSNFVNYIEKIRVNNENSDFILIGHGFGGLIIQNFLREKIEKLSLDEVSYIRQLILYSVPNYGLRKGSILKKVIPRKKNKPIFKLINGISEDLSELRTLIKENLVLADEFSSQSKPLSVLCLGSEDDKVVDENSSKGDFRNYKSLIGDHQSIIIPLDKNDIRFENLKDSLLSPPVHPSIFEIEYMKTKIEVEPIDHKEYTVSHGEISRKLKTDNRGIISRTVKFSTRNICKDMFTLRYGIENEHGFISAKTFGGKNETNKDNIKRYEKRGLEYFFSFFPYKNLDQTYTLEVGLLDGFRETNRDVHFHLGKGRNRYEKISIELNLTAYKNKGFAIDAKLYLHPEDQHSCEYRFQERIPSHIVPSSKIDDRGIWEWEINNVSGGVIDVCWQLA